MYSEVTPEDDARLKELNQSVTDAIAVRRAWLDAKCTEYSPLKVGDEIWDLNAGWKLGTVTDIYRFWRDRNDGVLDTSLSYEYQYLLVGQRNSYDNTSRQTGVSFGTKEQAIARQESRLAGLRR
jgi:hypothetical protein